MPHIFSVKELTVAIKDVLEAEFPFVWVRGQVSGVSRPGSGHIYFTLKDQDAALSVVWFKSSQWDGAGVASGGMSGASGVTALPESLPESLAESLAEPLLEPLSGRLADGMEVLCAGRLNVYAPRGSYQLVAEMVQEQGVGALWLQFEELKRKLAGLGWFDPEGKQQLPYNPSRVAVITAPTGAAVRDFLRLARERGTGAHIRIYPALVQGAEAPKMIAAQVRRAIADEFAETIVVIRGGGSLEDLWAFNTEAVARALVESPIPTLTGIGHEVDTTIADMVADVRAATPSHAAQLLWPERTALMQDVDTLEMALRTAAVRLLDAFDLRLAQLDKGLSWLSPSRGLETRLERLEGLERRLKSAGERLTDLPGRTLERLDERLRRAFGPWLADERLHEVALLTMRLERAGTRMIATPSGLLDVLDARLAACDPRRPLERGYSLVRVRRTGRLLRAPAEVRPGDALDILSAGGHTQAIVGDADESGSESDTTVERR